MNSPWIAAEPLPPAERARLRRRAIFDCNKWDPQVGDVCAIADQPLVIRRAAWEEVVVLAEALAAETAAAEAELLARPELHRTLGLPRAVRAALAEAARAGPSRGAARLIRFDFHHTVDGWRISEANTDVPGGLNEASGFPALMAPHYPWAAPVGDPAAAYVDALLAAAREHAEGTAGGERPATVAARDAAWPAAAPAAEIALVHATAYSDDQQMLAFLAERLARGSALVGVGGGVRGGAHGDAHGGACDGARGGARSHLCSPGHLRWRDGRARLEADWWQGPLDLVVRFFPADWLVELPRRCGWPALFAGGRTPISNPATALVTQSKRWPLVWHELDTPLPTWRALLPETVDPRRARWRDGDAWVLKPALGRVGEGISVPGVVEPQEARAIHRDVRWHPRDWVAQRRFVATALEQGSGPCFPCLGVYTLDGRVVGAYGRLAARALIDGRAQDAAVLAAA